MNIAKLVLVVANLVSLGAAFAFAYFHEPLLATGFIVESLIFTWATARHWNEL
jgi:hypothetical protein